MGGLLFLLGFYWPFFTMLDTGVTALIWLAFLLAYALGMAPMLSVEPAWFAELFPTDFRYKTGLEDMPSLSARAFTE